LKTRKIMIAGINGMVGKSIKNSLENSGYVNIVGPSSIELDFRDFHKTKSYLEKEMPDIIIVAAARVGGIMANIENPVSFLQDNLEIQTSIIKAAHLSNINNLIFLSSSCVYPREVLQPMKEEYLMTGKLEPTNEGYAIAKLAGMKLIEAYRKQYNRNYFSLIPCNLYGPHDNFDPIHSHVVSGLIRKLHEAKHESFNKVTLWGTGNAKRELMYVEDFASAVIYFIENPINKGYINIGTGNDISIKDLSMKIAHLIDFKGEIDFDEAKPDGMPRKVMDISELNQLGWTSSINLDQGLALTIKWYIENFKN
jgi:GDP-L-fucose synthase